MNQLIFLRVVGSALLAGTLLGGLGGCAKKPSSVEGSVVFDGKPVERGTIVFVPQDAEESGNSPSGLKKVGVKIAGGKYSVGEDQGIVPGNYRVQITWDRKTGKTITVDEAIRAETVQMLPEKYNKETTLTAEIKSSENQIDFDLKP
jgi:hypothetical protein